MTDLLRAAFETENSQRGSNNSVRLVDHVPRYKVYVESSGQLNDFKKEGKIKETNAKLIAARSDVPAGGCD